LVVKQEISLETQECDSILELYAISNVHTTKLLRLNIWIEVQITL